MAMGSMNVGLSLSASGLNSSVLSDQFPDPFMDMASTAMPENINYALRWCEFIFMSNGTYRQAVERVLTYFITDVEIADCSDDEREKWQDVLDDNIDIKNVLHVIGLDAMCYGNAFISVIPGFKRYLSCPECGIEFPLARVYNDQEFRFKWSDFNFHAKCPKCNFVGVWKRIDRRTGVEGDFRIKRWNPHEMDILWDPLTDDTSYIWKIPEDYKSLIKKGTLYHLERANWEIIECIKNNDHLLFDKDVIFHMREDALAGIRNKGWGISRVLSNFRQAWYVQVLHRYNEAIALDYVIPFRLLTPVPGDKGIGADPLLNQNMGSFNSSVHNMLKKRRRDPASWHTLPFPIQYQALGGDAKQLAPRELLDQGMETLLNSIGVPVDLYKGSLQVQAAPAALRLFEASWSTLPHNFNNAIRFIVKQISQLFSWEAVKAKLTRVSHADDLQRQQTKLQLMMGGQISQSTGLKSVGLDLEEETRRKMQDEEMVAKETARLQERMQNSANMESMAQPAQPGAPPPAGPGGQPAGGGGGGAPPPQQGGPMGMAAQSVMANLPTGPNQSITPQELLSRAQYVATQILGMPEAQKDSELIKLKKMDPVLHSQVKAQMDQIRQQARTQGGAALIAQQFGKPD